MFSTRLRRYPPQLAVHNMTVLEEGEGGACTLFDFLPCNPTDTSTGARLESPIPVKGQSLGAAVTVPKTRASVLSFATPNTASQIHMMSCRLLLGGYAAGHARTRRLSRLPPRRCRLVAELDVSLPEVNTLPFKMRHVIHGSDTDFSRVMYPAYGVADVLCCAGPREATHNVQPHKQHLDVISSHAAMSVGSFMFERSSTHAQARAMAETFQEQWDPELRLFRHDCRHHTELGCAVRAAVDPGAIDRRRYESYLGMT